MMLFKQILKSAVAALFIVGAQSAMATTTDECYSVPDAGENFATALMISPDVPKTGPGVRIRGCLNEESSDLVDMFKFEAEGYFQVNLEALVFYPEGSGNVEFKIYNDLETELDNTTLSSSPLLDIFGSTFSKGIYYLGLTLNINESVSSVCQDEGYIQFEADEECQPRPPVLSNYTFQLKNAPAPVPLPAALPMLLAGIGGLGLVARRRKNKVS